MARKKELKGINKFGRGLKESIVGFGDGVMQGLTGIDLVKDDYYQTGVGEGLNKFTKAAAPVAAGITAGVLTGNPAVGNAVYQGTNALSDSVESAFDTSQDTGDLYSGIDPMIAEYGAFTGRAKMFNIERGELLVDPKTGDIVKSFESAQYKPHSKDKSKEHRGNFVEIDGDYVIIPKKDATAYKNNSNMRQGIMRNVVNMHKQRMAYGVDANGNMQEYSSLAPQAQAGIMTGFQYDPIFNMYSSGFDDGFTDNSFFNEESVIQGLNYDNKNYVLDTLDPLNKEKTKTEFSAPGLTTGDYIGIGGNLISAIAPLAITKKVGIDKDETNTFAGVTNRAANALSSTLGRSREDALKTLRTTSNLADNQIRNASSNFSTMSARSNAATNNLNQNIAKTALQYDLPLAQGLSGLYAQGDMAYAQAEQDRLQRLDMNRDNYYSNLSRNYSNIGLQTQGAAKTINDSETNKILESMLKDGSAYFYYDKDGKKKIAFKK